MFSTRDSTDADVDGLFGDDGDTATLASTAERLRHLRSAELVDNLQRTAPDDYLPHTLNVCLRPLTAHCPEARASGIYTAIPDTDKFRVSPEWHARHHGYRICICPQYMTWKLVAGNGVCVAETLPRVDQSTRLGVALPHARDVEWRSCNANVVGSFEVSVVGEMHAGKEAVERMRQRLQKWRMAVSRASTGFRRGFVAGTADHADVVEMSNRVLCGLRVMAGMKKRGGRVGARTFLLLEHVANVRRVQRCWRRFVATRNARLGSLLEAWREQDEAKRTRLRSCVRSAIEKRSSGRGQYEMRLAEMDRVTDNHRRASLMTLYKQRKGEWDDAKADASGGANHASPRYLDSVLPTGAETLAAARKMLEKLTDVWVRQRCEAERGELDVARASPRATRWSLTWAAWQPRVDVGSPLRWRGGVRRLCSFSRPPSRHDSTVDLGRSGRLLSRHGSTRALLNCPSFGSALSRVSSGSLADSMDTPSVDDNFLSPHSPSPPPERRQTSPRTPQPMRSPPCTTTPHPLGSTSPMSSAEDHTWETHTPASSLATSVSTPLIERSKSAGSYRRFVQQQQWNSLTPGSPCMARPDAGSRSGRAGSPRFASLAHQQVPPQSAQVVPLPCTPPLPSAPSSHSSSWRARGRSVGMSSLQARASVSVSPSSSAHERERESGSFPRRLRSFSSDRSRGGGSIRTPMRPMPPVPRTGPSGTPSLVSVFAEV